MALAVVTPIGLASGIDNDGTNEQLNTTKDTNLIFVDKCKFNKEMTKEEFYNSNSEYYAFLSENIGEKAATKMLDEAYNSSSGANNQLGSIDDIVPYDVTTGIVQVQGDSVYLWPFTNGQSNMNSHNGCVNAIFYYKTVPEIANELKNSGHWHKAIGSTEWGLHGDNPTYMTWSSSPGGDNDGNYQLEDGSYFGTRYHLALFDGDYESNHGMNWCYGNAHYEYWDTMGPNGPNHYLYSNSFDEGENHVRSTVYDHLSWRVIYTLDMHNEWSGLNDQWGYLFEMSH